MEKFMCIPIVDRLMGCMFGAFIGDSLGSHCEFKSKEVAEKLVDKAMEMPGGGPFQLMAGQVTDDSEMAMHMLKGLLCYDPTKPL
jgi:ADP-ribosyl-[dinitrogen reductase] hydrolase